MAKGRVSVRRAYDEPSADDGTRVLVDRVWPRGLAKQAARLDDWAKDVAPSPSCASGTATTQSSSRSFADAIEPSCAACPAGTHWIRCGRWPGTRH